MSNVLFKYINANSLFRDYLPHIKCKYLKLRGKGTDNKPLYFTDQERHEIIDAIRKMADDIEKLHRNTPIPELYRKSK